MHCQDCGHTWTGPGYDQDIVPSVGCPNCGSFRTQVSPTHSEMAIRDMPSPGGMDDPGGNPLQEGIWGSIDGGWQNRMKRDESFASVQAAKNPYDPMQKWVEDAEQMERERQFVEGPGPSKREHVHDPWKLHPSELDPEVARELFAENPSRFIDQFGKSKHIKDMMAFDIGDKPAHSDEWLGQPGSLPNIRWRPGDTGKLGGKQGRGLIDSRGTLHVWPEDDGLHKEYMRRNRIPSSQVEFTVSPEGMVEVSHGFDPSLLEQHQDELQQAGLTYDPNYDPFAEFGDFNFMNDENEDDVGVSRAANNREKIYLPWTRETSSVEHDFEVEQVVPPGPHTEEVDYGDSTPLILQHDDPQLLDHAKQKLEASGTATSFRVGADPNDVAAQQPAAQRCGCESSHCPHHNDRPGTGPYDSGWRPCSNPAGARQMQYVGAICDDCARVAQQSGGSQYLISTVKEATVRLSFLPLLLGLGAGALAGEGAAAMGAGALGSLGARAAVGHLVRGALQGQPGGAPGGAPPAAPEQEQLPEQALASVHNSILTELAAFDGPFDNHPSSDQGLVERADGDPEDADPNEVNDGDHDHWQRDKDVNDQGGTDAFSPDVLQALEDAEPSLLHYFNSEESGANDPAIQKLIEALERDHPGLLDQEADPDTVDFVNTHARTAANPGQMGVPGIGGIPPTPGTQQLQDPVANPQQQVNPTTQASCPHCGARLTAGQGVCPQCNGSVSLQPNTPQEGAPGAPGAYPTGQQPYPAQPGMGAGIVARQAANQGPHNPQQFQAVADYLKQNTPPDQIGQALQDLIMHPDNYGDILAQIQGKGQPPQPDPDPGPPPPMPPPGAMPPGGMPPGGAPPGQMPMATSRQAADAVAPTCPNCGSHTTESEISDVEPGNFSCHRCGHIWKRDDVVPTKSSATHDPGAWATVDGHPLEVGREYDMKSAKYDIPDTIRVESVKPDELEYTLVGAYNLAHRTAVSKEEAEMDGLTFEYAGPDENDILNEQGPNEQMEAPTMPAYAAVKQAVGPHDMMGPVYPEEHALQSQNFPGEGKNAPYVPCPGCKQLTRPALGGCPRCGTPIPGGPITQPLDEWAHDTVENPQMPTELPGYEARVAGKKFTPMEQREFIDEPGVARNSDKLDLEGTHYTEQENLSDDLFLFGL